MSIVTRKRNGTMDKQPLLSICIPTWNRSKILSMSLDCFRKQLSSIDLSEIELFVSDNCSDDDTSAHECKPIRYFIVKRIKIIVFYTF